MKRKISFFIVLALLFQMTFVGTFGAFSASASEEVSSVEVSEVSVVSESTETPLVGDVSEVLETPESAVLSVTDTEVVPESSESETLAIEEEASTPAEILAVEIATEESAVAEFAVEESVATEVSTASSSENVVYNPELSTEKADYHPGETATIFGKFFGKLQTFVLKIFGSDDNDQNYTEETQELTTDEDGNFVTTYLLDNIYRPFYEMTASTIDGVLLATGWFRDSAVGTYDQCSNDDGDGYATGNTGCRWINGNLNSNNSTYIEGDSTVQRVWMEGYAPGTSHTLTFQYGTTKAGKHAYDYLTTWDSSENWITLADRCEDIIGCTSASEQQFPMVDDPSTPNTIEPDPANRKFTIRGGTITAVSTPTIVSGTYAGDSETEVTVTFTVDNSGDMCKTKSGVTSCSIAIWFGAHIAKGSEWTAFDGTTGAGSISGSPYHVALTKNDGASVGQRDNQMQANNLVAPTYLTLIKTVTNDNGGTAQASAWTLSANGAGSNDISGVTGSANVTNAVVQPDTFVLSESGPAGYFASNWSCVGGSLTGNSLTLIAGDNAVCTINNNDIAPMLKLVKTVTNDNGGTKQPSDFTLYANGLNGFVDNGASNTFHTVNAGVGYALSETSADLLAGYTASPWSCDGGTLNGSTITLGLAQNVTCTINNNDQPAYITVVKVVHNDNGGTALPNDFNLTLGGNSVLSGVPVQVTPGTYTAGETLLFGYSFLGFTGFCDSNGQITVALGESKTCTLTNDDQPGHLIVHKVTVPEDTTTEFDISINANVLGGSDRTIVGGGEVDYTVNAGTYSVSEDPKQGWTETGNTCVNVTVTPGETKHCTITNTQLGTIIVKKNAIPDNNIQAFTFNNNFGNGNPAVFQLTDTTDAGLPSFTAYVLPGKYAVTEDATPGWQLKSAVCDMGETVGDIDVAPGETVTCTFTNEQLAKITLVKNTIGGDAEFNFTGTGTGLPASITLNTSSGTASVTYDNLNPDNTYSISENVPSGWELVGTPSCTGTNTPAEITPNAGEEIICTFTNGRLPTLKLEKTVINDNGGTKVASDFQAMIDANNVLWGAVQTLPTGNYNASETNVPGYLASAWGGDCDVLGNVALAYGDVKVCTITNDDIAPTLTLVKVVEGEGSPADFTLTATGPTGFSGAGPNVSNGASFDAGKYDLSESGPSGYYASAWSCVVNGGQSVEGSSITLGLDDDAVCTITNTKILALEVSKTTETSYTRTYDWNIEKSVDQDTHNLFVGDTGTSNYEVKVTKDAGTDSAWMVTGTITITNPNTHSALVANITDISDLVSNEGVATVNCPGGLNQNLNPGATLICTYSKALTDGTNETNTATVTTIGLVPGGAGNADVTFGNPTTLVNDKVNVTDTIEGPLGETATSTTYNYSKDFTCGANQGGYSGTGNIVENIAKITETGDEDDASVTVNCYGLNVTKDASTSLTRTWNWTIEKVGDQTSLNLSPGQIYGVNYDVTVNATSQDSAWAVSGNITIANPAPMDANLSSVADVVSLGINATVNCPATTVPANSSLVCTYTTALPNAETRTNTATVTLANGTQFSGSTPVSFASATVNKIDEEITINDDKYGVLGIVNANDTLPKVFEYMMNVGPYEQAQCGTIQAFVNTATFTTNDTGTTGSDNHTVNSNVQCVCSLTQGYWKTHNDSFKGGAPADENWLNLLNGENTMFYQSGQTWFQVFWTAPKGNVYYNLAHQYMAAKLNVLNGAYAPTQVANALAQAETWFGMYTPAQVKAFKNNQKNQWTNLAGVLGAFNEGLTNPAGHCSEVPVN